MYMYHLPPSLLHIVEVRQREDPASVSSTILSLSFMFDAILIVVDDFVVIRTIRAIGFLHGVMTTRRGANNPIDHLAFLPYPASLKMHTP